MSEKEFEDQEVKEIVDDYVNSRKRSSTIFLSVLILLLLAASAVAYYQFKLNKEVVEVTEEKELIKLERNDFKTRSEALSKENEELSKRLKKVVEQLETDKKFDRIIDSLKLYFQWRNEHDPIKLSRFHADKIQYYYAWDNISKKKALGYDRHYYSVYPNETTEALNFTILNEDSLIRCFVNKKVYDDSKDTLLILQEFKIHPDTEKGIRIFYTKENTDKTTRISRGTINKDNVILRTSPSTKGAEVLDKKTGGTIRLNMKDQVRIESTIRFTLNYSQLWDGYRVYDSRGIRILKTESEKYEILIPRTKRTIKQKIDSTKTVAFKDIRIIKHWYEVTTREGYHGYVCGDFVRKAN